MIDVDVVLVKTCDPILGLVKTFFEELPLGLECCTDGVFCAFQCLNYCPLLVRIGPDRDNILLGYRYRHCPNRQYLG